MSLLLDISTILDFRRKLEPETGFEPRIFLTLYLLSYPDSNPAPNLNFSLKIRNSNFTSNKVFAFKD
jgi:hypothetical protein